MAENQSTESQRYRNISMVAVAVTVAFVVVLSEMVCRAAIEEA